MPAPLDCSQMLIDGCYLCLNPLPLCAFAIFQNCQHRAQPSALHIPMMNVVIRHLAASSAKPGYVQNDFPTSHRAGNRYLHSITKNDL